MLAVPSNVLLWKMSKTCNNRQQKKKKMKPCPHLPASIVLFSVSAIFPNQICNFICKHVSVSPQKVITFLLWLWNHYHHTSHKEENFFWRLIYLKGRWEKEIFCLLTYSPNGHGGPDWARLEPGARAPSGCPMWKVVAWVTGLFSVALPRGISRELDWKGAAGTRTILWYRTLASQELIYHALAPTIISY